MPPNQFKPFLLTIRFKGAIRYVGRSNSPETAPQPGSLCLP